MAMRVALWLRTLTWVVLAGLLAGCIFPPWGSGPAPTEPANVSGNLPEYLLALDLDAAARRLAGHQQVIFSNDTGAALDEVVFRLYPNLPQYQGRMHIGPVWVDGERTPTSLRAQDTSLVVPLVRTLEPKESVTISMTFDLDIPQRPGGYVLFGYSQGIWSLPDAYPLLAVHDKDGWLEDVAPAHGDAVFADVARYDVRLTLPPTLTLVATGAVLSETQTAEGRRTYHVGGAPLREFAWLASADYQVAETVAQGTTVYSFYLPGDKAAGQAVLNIAAASLRAYTEAFGPYPYSEMAIVEAPLSFYGMEYPGLNLIGLDLYRDLRIQLEDRVVHEIAHQWWYAQVGNDQVNTPWLDEGLAEYSMATYYREVYGEAQANTLINQRWLVPYQTAVENDFDAVVNQPAAAFGQEYELIVYAKAALFFNALYQELGPDTYHAALNEYLTRYRWRIATPDDFLQVAESVSGQELDALYNRWILSKR